MSYEKELAFFRQTLQKMNIQTLVFSQDQTPEFPQGLEILQSMVLTQKAPFQELNDHVIYSVRDAMAMKEAVFKMLEKDLLLFDDMRPCPEIQWP